MGTDAYIIAEKRNESGDWELVSYSDEYEKAIEILESRDYFKYSFLTNTRNCYMLKKNLLNYYRVQKRSPEVTQKMIDEEYGENCWGGFGWGEDPFITYAEYDISRHTASAIDFPQYIIDMKSLLEFDYDQKIEIEIDEDSIYYSDHRANSVKGNTYRDELGKYFFESLEVLKNLGADRILISYD